MVFLRDYFCLNQLFAVIVIFGMMIVGILTFVLMRMTRTSFSQEGGECGRVI